jgi:hypothetical protein
MPARSPAVWRCLLGAGQLALAAGRADAQIGPMFSGVRAANLSMGGAAVATANGSTNKCTANQRGNRAVMVSSL